MFDRFGTHAPPRRRFAMPLGLGAPNPQFRRLLCDAIVFANMRKHIDERGAPKMVAFTANVARSDAARVGGWRRAGYLPWSANRIAVPICTLVGVGNETGKLALTPPGIWVNGRSMQEPPIGQLLHDKKLRSNVSPRNSYRP
jgi:hypothetical protein